MKKKMSHTVPDEDENIHAKTIERRPLDVLLAMGEIAPVNSGSIVYLNEYLINETGMQKQEIINKWFNNSPVVSSIINTPLGSIAVTTIPMFSKDLYINQEALVTKVLEATKLMGHFGAKVVSLTGTIPSATDYGNKIISNSAYNNQLPDITTGHETTTATVLMTIEKILESADRKIENETIGFLGLGSVGTATLQLMVKSLPFPRELILCDLYTKANELERMKQDLINTYHFDNKISIVTSSQNIPDEFYHSTFIVGATNVPDILDIFKLKSGTMIVDDSGPHCFDVKQAIARFEKDKDILFTEGGVLNLIPPYSCTLYIPNYVEKAFTEEQKRNLLHYNPSTITSCVLSGQLMSQFDELKTTVGHTDIDMSYQNYKKLKALGLTAADLHCGDYLISEIFIDHFRKNY